MKCIICCKEFQSKRKDAKFCSSTCRSNKFRTDNPATDNATDKDATDKSVSRVSENKENNIIPNKDSWLCKVEDCNLQNMPGHGGMCIYHWRKEEKLSTIPKDQYDQLNGVPC